MTSSTRHDARTARPVRIVTTNPMADHRTREVRVITTAIAAVCALAAGCAIVPAFDSLIDTVTGAAVVALVVGGGLRWIARRVRWWIEDRADARTAAAWRAEHSRDGVRQEVA